MYPLSYVYCGTAQWVVAGLYLEHLVEVLAAEHIMTIMTMAENCISFICMQRYTKSSLT